MYYNDMGGGYAYEADAGDYKRKFWKYQNELEKLGFEPEKYL